MEWRKINITIVKQALTVLEVSRKACLPVSSVLEAFRYILYYSRDPPTRRKT